MAGGTMNKPRFLSLLLPALLALAACQSPSAEPPLAGARIGGPFTLTDQDGRRVTDAQFAGRYRLVYFGYTYCPDVCPTDMQTLGRGLSLFEKQAPALAAKVQPIFITVDPARDTPAVLKQWVAAFHPRLIGLTGSEAQIAAVAKEYAVIYQRVETPGSTSYLMNHTRTAVLFGPKGEPLALIPQDETPEAAAAELAKWVK
ncbi:SCO family protein [Sphingomonas solaris]|uniref:SCO family protein n=1 Tax=Alterirhizorhabdus solaris TaxID=2529389 RepID=A0A558R3F4_9SPHN|nr:SCO family protein [Sphingomonas solaris]TVV73887.1 SCO family protein [Sphingomonas solaris]